MRLYPEDIEQFFDMVPVGTQVRVVNQPFVFGWHDEQLYLQPYDVLEDDTRDWKKAQQKLLDQVARGPHLQQDLKEHQEQVDWELVASLAPGPARRSGAGHRSPVPASMSRARERAARAERARRSAPAGTASRICRWTRPPSSR